jgi:cysteine-rich repeat protein
VKTLSRATLALLAVIVGPSIAFAATERLSPDAITASTSLNGTVTAIQDDPDAPDGSFLTQAGAVNTSTSVRVSFPTPSGLPTIGGGLQECRAQVRRSNAAGTNACNPTVTFTIRDNGSVIATSAPLAVTDGTSQIVSFLWNAGSLNVANGSAVECQIAGAGCDGATGHSVEIGAIEWNVDFTATPTATATATPVPTLTATVTLQPTLTATPEPTATATETPLPTATETPEPTATATETPLPTATETPEPTATATETPLPTATETPEPTATATETPEPTATETPEPTATATETPLPTATETPEPTVTATETPEPTATETPEPTVTATETPEETATPTESPTPTATETPEETATPTESPTPTATETPEETATPTESPTPTATSTEATPTPTESATPIATPTEGTPIPTGTVTPTASVTPTPSTSATPTVGPTATPGPLDHFLCYEIHRPSINEDGVGTSDRYFPNGSVKVRQAKRLCAPVNKNGEDPTAPTHPGHQTFYTIKQTSPKFARTKDIPIVVLNDFDSDAGNEPLTNFTVDLVRAERMLVPTSKSLIGPNFPDPLNVALDHYKCYRVRGARFRRASVNVETQFGTLTVDIKRPRDLCVPVEKTHDNVVTPIVNPGLALMCFQVRTTPQNATRVFTTNQFEQGAYDIFGVRDLCVPAYVDPKCGDGSLNTPAEQCESGQGNDAACPGLCDTQTCTCDTPPAPFCGDGIINQQGEQCEGDADCLFGCRGRDCLIRAVNPAATCNDDCQCVPAPFCGDGNIDAGLGEECDDGFLNNADDRDCTLSCQSNVCGDAKVNTQGPQNVEACDDGNAVDGDGCDNNCTTSGCGNGVVAGSETCDDGNVIDGDGCDSNCTTTACGNGVVTAPEECDDGVSNADNADCTAACKSNVCGDGKHNTVGPNGLEGCDDGNQIDNDSCSNMCLASIPCGTPGAGCEFDEDCCAGSACCFPRGVLGGICCTD